MAGSPASYENDPRAQLLAYVNRLGAGAVVYWFGFAAELQDLDEDILLLDGWPERGTLFWPDGRAGPSGVWCAAGCAAPPGVLSRRVC